jgi:hypothetical protein
MTKSKQKNAAKKPRVPKLKTQKKGAHTEKPALKPVTGRTTKADIGALLAKSNGAPAPPVTHLNRKEIHAAEEGVFQWRRYGRDQFRSASHITTLARALNTMGEPFEPILVFPAGDRFFVIDGHHRLAAYDHAGWNAPIPVKVFGGGLEAARLAALQGNNRDKLPMTRTEKFDAAWRLVKEGGFSKSQIVALTAVSLGTVNNMRAKWAEIKAVGDDRFLKMDWAQAQRWKPGDGQDHHDDGWREKKVQALHDHIVKTGLATELGKYPDFVMEALSRIDPDLPATLAYEAGPEVAGWVLEQYRQNAAMDIGKFDVNEMHSF